MLNSDGENVRIERALRLDGRTALVTGGGGRIGAAICETLAELGAAVAVVDSDVESGRRVAERLSAEFSEETAAFVVDLTDDEAVSRLPGQVEKSLDRVDILVNCAAMVGTSDVKGWAVSFSEQSPETWRKALDVNLTAAFVLTQACADQLASSGHGAVINIGSIYGMIGPDLRLYDGTDMGNPAAYAAGKGGLLQLTRWLATVLAPDIRVNSISPGGVWRGQPEAFHEKYKAKTPLGRMAVEDDIKGAVAYLATDLSAYVTGHNLVVDGGWTAW